MTFFISDITNQKNSVKVYNLYKFQNLFFENLKLKCQLNTFRNTIATVVCALK